MSRCAVSYWYFQYQDAYSVILVFINTSVKSALCHTGIYKYQCQDAYSVILVFINTSVKVPIVSYWYL